MHKRTSLFTFQNKSLRLHDSLSKKLRENVYQNSEFDDGNSEREKENQPSRLS
jgi:hypothetical protein